MKILNIVMNTIRIIEYDYIHFYFELQIYVKKYGHSQKRVSHLLNLCDTFLFCTNLRK